jgi:hypothetical protein
MNPLFVSDQFDIRDVIERFEELEEKECDKQEAAEFQLIKTLLEEVRGEGGDEKWRGDWYPLGFIRDSYFTKYAEELAKDVGDVPSKEEDIRWPFNCIDWEAAADLLKEDYSSVEIAGVTYWYR